MCFSLNDSLFSNDYKNYFLTSLILVFKEEIQYKEIK